MAGAKEAGLAGLALTDHDTIDGLPEFFQAVEDSGLTGVGGVEISVEHPGTMHILGYNVSGQMVIPAALNKLKTFRLERNRQLYDKLQGLGYGLSWENILARSDGQLGRPHFAAALIEAGYFQTSQDVFEQLLAKGRPGYVNKQRLTPAQGLDILREAGWAPVLAHPVSLGLTAGEWPVFLKTLKEQGLVGLEVFHPNHGVDDSNFFEDQARRLGLVPTVGSDFHGANKPHIGLDWARSHDYFGPAMLEGLKSAL